jgi:sporulation protein YlmC with PRC-barrel domain
MRLRQQSWTGLENRNQLPAQDIFMKATLDFLMGAVVTSALTLSLTAAERTNPANASARGYEAGRAVQAERLGRVVKASEVIGSEVKNLQDEKLGKVEDMAVDVETGRIVQILVSSGGILGMGDKVTAVPPAAFTCEAPHPSLRLDATKDKLKGAPAFEMAKWEDLTKTNRIMEGYRYFGKEPYFARGSKLAAPGPQTIERASRVIGASVKDEANEKLGKVENLMVDVEGGRIVQVILASGGFLGLGDDLRALPPSAFRYLPADNTLVIHMTKDAITRGPRFKTGEWPDFGDPAYSASVYRAYRVEPYFNVDADNTRRNVRDRDSRQLTPLDQGTSAADLETTRRIRKEIVDQQGLSLNARNIKVITQNGRVTLRGPVNTAQEKRILEEIAQRIAQAANVDSQLEVKQSADR